jgi:molybdenum cofactor cytidylyltransferase
MADARSPLRIAGLLLAAGRGLRFGGGKLRAPLPPGTPLAGMPVGVAACARLVATGVETFAVVRPGDAALAAALAGAGARVVVCADADDGMGRSLACGVAATTEADAWLVALADMPWIAPATYEAVIAALRAGAVVAAPFHRGVRGHPVGFGGACRAALLALSGDEGARGVIGARREALQRIDVDDPGALADVDTPADLAPR